MGATMNNESKITESPPLNGQQSNPPGGLQLILQAKSSP